MKRGDLRTLHPICEETNYKDSEIPGLFVNTGRNKLHTAVCHNGPNYITPQIQISEVLYNFQRNVAILTPLPSFTQCIGKMFMLHNQPY